MQSQSNKTFRHAWLAGMAAILLAGCDSGQPSEPEKPAAAPQSEAATEADDRRTALRQQAASLFGPLPAVKADDSKSAQIDLGRKLYFDTRLSLDNDISCNSCHGLNSFGVDNEPTSPGHLGQRGDRNSPTVYNATLHVAQFWDGRATDLTEQAKGPVLNPIEMAMNSEGEVVARLAAIPGYVELFLAAFPEDKPALSYQNMAAAIARFEEGLITPDRFDAFMKGDLNALSEPEIVGLELFLQTGCAACHSGPALGGNMYQKMGLVKPYETEDAGRFAVTGNEADRQVFKVPSLRNIARTAPYFHDGSVTRLVDAIQLMAGHQLGKELSDADVASIAMFLESLTGTPDAEYIAPPELPEGEIRLSAGDAS